MYPPHLAQIRLELCSHGIESLWTVEAEKENLGRRELHDEVRADRRMRCRRHVGGGGRVKSDEGKQGGGRLAGEEEEHATRGQGCSRP